MMETRWALDPLGVALEVIEVRLTVVRPSTLIVSEIYNLQ